nr:MAG TPA: hypothetical protein [Caudoviricetes sp.]
MSDIHRVLGPVHIGGMSQVRTHYTPGKKELICGI